MTIGTAAGVTRPPRILIPPTAANEFVSEVRLAAKSGGGELVGDPDNADAIIWLDKGGAAELAQLIRPNIRWVQLIDAGVDRWIRTGLLESGPVVTCARGWYAPQVAEHALALLLAGARRLHECARATTWGSVGGTSLRGAEITIVGAGSIGAELIMLLAQIGSRVTAVNRTGQPVSGAAVTIARPDLLAALSDASFVVLCASLTTETHHLMSKPEFDAMRNDAWIVNVGRGELVDTSALLGALNEASIGGAALDVTDPEPLPDAHPLWKQPNVLITPHCANPPSLKQAAFVRQVQDNLSRFRDGRELMGVVDLVREY